MRDFLHGIRINVLREPDNRVDLNRWATDQHIHNERAAFIAKHRLRRGEPAADHAFGITIPIEPPNEFEQNIIMMSRGGWYITRRAWAQITGISS